MADLLTVSHSQLDQWDRCRYAWHLGYELGWKPKETSTALALGSMSHEFLAEGYAFVSQEKDPLAAVNTAMHEKIASSSLSYEDVDTVNRAGWLVDRYFRDFAPFQDLGWKIVDIEQKIETKFITPTGRDFILLGFFDLLVEDKNGRLWLIDHKTVGHGKFYSPVEVMMDNQLATYVAALRALGIDVFGIIYNMLNTYQYKDREKVGPDKLFRREQSYRTQQELDAMVMELGRAVDDMLDNRDNIRRSLKRECSFCRFQEPCLMNMKGMDLDDIMPINFVKKGEEAAPAKGGVPHIRIL